MRRERGANPKSSSFFWSVKVVVLFDACLNELIYVHEAEKKRKESSLFMCICEEEEEFFCVLFFSHKKKCPFKFFHNFFPPTSLESF